MQRPPLRILLSIAFILFTKSTTACTEAVMPANDTSITVSKNNYHLSEVGFLTNYGKDDTSRALIRYYFRKRTMEKKLIYIPLTAGVLIGTAIGITALFTTLNFEGWSFIAVFLLGAIFAAIVSIVTTGIVMLIFNSRKKLLKRLNEYFSGNPIPAHLARSKVFRQFLTNSKVMDRRHAPRRNKAA